MLSAIPVAGEGRGIPYAGRPLVEVIDEFRQDGVEIVYSTSLVTDDLHVASEPEPGTPLQIMRQVLRPHGLTVRDEQGVYLIVRAAVATPPSSDAVLPAPAVPTIDNVIVAASRYEISREMSGSRFVLDRRTIQDTPDIGEDPIRVTQRLPGTAARDRKSTR